MKKIDNRNRSNAIHYIKNIKTPSVFGYRKLGEDVLYYIGIITYWNESDPKSSIIAHYDNNIVRIETIDDLSITSNIGFIYINSNIYPGSQYNSYLSTDKGYISLNHKLLYQTMSKDNTEYNNQHFCKITLDLEGNDVTQTDIFKYINYPSWWNLLSPIYKYMGYKSMNGKILTSDQEDIINNSILTKWTHYLDIPSGTIYQI